MLRPGLATLRVANELIVKGVIAAAEAEVNLCISASLFGVKKQLYHDPVTLCYLRPAIKN